MNDLKIPFPVKWELERNRLNPMMERDLDVQMILDLFEKDEKKEETIEQIQYILEETEDKIGNISKIGFNFDQQNLIDSKRVLTYSCDFLNVNNDHSKLELRLKKPSWNHNNRLKKKKIKKLKN